MGSVFFDIAKRAVNGASDAVEVAKWTAKGALGTVVGKNPAHKEDWSVNAGVSRFGNLGRKLNLNLVDNISALSQKALKKVVKSNPVDREICLAAVKEIKDQDFLSEIIEDPSKIMIAGAFMGPILDAALDGIERPDLLEKIAISGDSNDFLNRNNLDVKAIEKITDTGSLKRVIENSKNDHVSNMAKARLKELPVPVQAATKKAAPAAPKSQGRGM